MANRVKTLLNDYIHWSTELKSMAGRNRRGLQDMIERAKRNLLSFGTRYHLVEVVITYYPLKQILDNGNKVYGEITTDKLFLTDCTTEEAHTLIYEFRYARHKIETCKITRIPLNNPIKVYEGKVKQA